jgi:type III secretion system YscQ/HrcQ family protein
MKRNWREYDFGALPSFSKRQVAAWNTLRRHFCAEAKWQDWITEGLTGILEMPAGFEIRLRQRHTVEHREAVFTSNAGTLTLGRDEACDVRLQPRSVGNLHARIGTCGGRCCLEDLGSALGTFLNDSRLAPNQPVPIATGDQFAIFPYAFTVEITERWIRSVPVDVHAGPLLPLNPRSVERLAKRNRTAFVIHVQPPGASFLLEADRSFIENLSAQILAPLGPDGASYLSLTPVDTGLFELLVTAVLERANRDLRFPLRAALDSGGLSTLPDTDGGLAFSFSVKVAEQTGTFRVLIGDKAVQAFGASTPPPNNNSGPRDISWAFLISAGYVELTGAEMTCVEPGDVVLLTRESAILFPNAPERGWRLQPQAGNISRVRVDKYFERGCLSKKESEQEPGPNAGTAPDLTGLPVRMHAIIGEKDMTLAEANLMAPGVIVELDGTKSDPLRIALNGKIAGFGELVEVDGRLGVRILSWKALTQ